MSKSNVAERVQWPPLEPHQVVNQILDDLEVIQDNVPSATAVIINKIKIKIESTQQYSVISVAASNFSQAMLEVVPRLEGEEHDIVYKQIVNISRLSRVLQGEPVELDHYSIDIRNRYRKETRPSFEDVIGASIHDLFREVFSKS